jgi:hypothetical protein
VGLSSSSVYYNSVKISSICKITRSLVRSDFGGLTSMTCELLKGQVKISIQNAMRHTSA